MNHSKINGLYVITDPWLCPNETIIDKVAAAIAGGAKIIQYRDKTQSMAVQKKIASQLSQVCHQQGALFIVNDSLELAQYSQADGIHLGKNDSNLSKARACLGKEAIIGISCYDSIERALEMQKLGADYVAFGRFFASQTKPDAPQASLRTLQNSQRHLQIPVVAIGGITPQNGAQLVSAGANSLAVIHAVFGQANIQESAQALSDLFHANKSL
ncbi:thiamine-phosphate synthase [Thiosulfatimonas sediminis]|uniref:Thiamine-phosphate synthase n=1 Tax=Thiosulfatimonas sediminis TaxID=2675054 RepID=A0A6F8PUK7_9GAMM|nr:thiamine phosphate synthase [Thiosulfatimonas sediminis]BBP45660.1 thiamine-phosphate synthase [Thiosulfatimonas sediminis]